jgi:signal peptidase I
MTDETPTNTTGVEARGNGQPRGLKLLVRDILLILLTAIVLSAGIKAFVVRSFYIPSESMNNTLQVHDRIIVNELVPRIFPIKRGDVVVFRDPGSWLPASTAVQASGLAAGVDWLLTMVGLSASDSDDHLVKRVIGLPGDKVACCNAFGQLTVNGIPLDEKSYVLLPAGVTAVSAIQFAVTVPKGRLWVMGDNRDNSKDSRYQSATPSHGFVPQSDVVGRAFVVSWPSSHWSWLDDYPRVFDGTDARAGVR